MGTGDDISFLNMDEGCPIHGDQYMKECAMCGVDFCGLCHPKSAVCPDCTTVDEEPDFDDVEDLDEVLEDDFEDDEELGEE